MPQVLFMYKCLNQCVVKYLFILKGLEDHLVYRVVLKKYHREYFISSSDIAPTRFWVLSIVPVGIFLKRMSLLELK